MHGKWPNLKSRRVQSHFNKHVQLPDLVHLITSPSVKTCAIVILLVLIFSHAIIIPTPKNFSYTTNKTGYLARGSG